MNKYRVSGTVTVSVYKTVEASSKEEAIEKAHSDFGGISEYYGNGGSDKLIGVSEADESIYGDGEVEFTSAEEV